VTSAPFPCLKSGHVAWEPLANPRCARMLEALRIAVGAVKLGLLRGAHGAPVGAEKARESAMAQHHLAKIRVVLKHSMGRLDVLP
jgi:hypothetical protein